ncbi:MAG: hypothetical protein AAF554_16905 [Bacteroidota bacterium]
MQTKFRTFNDFKNTFEKSESFKEEFTRNPEETMKLLEQEGPWFNDRVIYRWVVLFLGIIVLTICIGVIYLTATEVVNNEFNVPDILIATASTAIGAIAGLLTPGSSQNQSEE